MKMRALGRTGIEVSAIGLGTVKLGRDQGVKYPGAFSIPDDEAAGQLLDRAESLGINLIDTAPAYGVSEERVGALLADREHPWLCSTKVGEEFVDGVSTYNYTEAHTRMSVERSRKRLGRPVIDLVMIHSNGNDEQILGEEGVFPVLEECRAGGTIRAHGMSVKTVEGGLLAVALGLDVLMVEYHLWDRSMEPLLDAAYEAGCGILIKKAFASGHFGDGLGVAEALAFVLEHRAVSSVITGTINPAHLEENCRALIE
jgi:aryl-alcohol dehydrogenase-like predicted oxidoreductase